MSHLRPICLALGLPALAALAACSADTSSSTEAVSTCDAGSTPDAAPTKVCDAGVPSTTADAGTTTAAGCTRTQGYWKTHNEFATVDALRIDWPAPMDENQTMCGKTLLSILQTATRGDAWLILAHQYIAAELNIASGASTTLQIDGVMETAGRFLENHCDGRISPSLSANAIVLAGLLDSYNNGVVGPGHCGDVSTLSTSTQEITTERRME
jgi:hypothetical protein